MFQIFQSVLSGTMTPASFFGCLAASLVLGAAIAAVYMLTSSNYSSSFVVTLAIIPAVVQIIILMVNGNLGAGVAVAGAFSLVRFRSLPGTAKEIGAIFIALSTGLATGMGYLAFGAIYTIIMLAVLFIYSKTGFGGKKTNGMKVLTVTIPESLNYDTVMDEILEQYTSHHELISVKTTNMGSLFKLTYEIKLKEKSTEKPMIDAIRCKNANLEISCCKAAENTERL
ncbi:MAG: DUF4956 domain-containing protein [Faecalibacterium sp.]|nr:DUF4956 domain-containing protein [Ruminococcus sp.]MCM1392160.1 DUF4956 domain-containing protein [Ruminococcus sp.]MCM1486036.1 DUF4956 domain-containing protein [Faecalibacterium sp.]